MKSKFYKIKIIWSLYINNFYKNYYNYTIVNNDSGSDCLRLVASTESFKKQNNEAARVEIYDTIVRTV